MDITPQRINLPEAAAQFRAAVSEYLAQSLGGANNFLNYFQHSEKQFFINGPYGITGGSQTFVDGLAVFEFQAQIIDVWMFNITGGSSSSTSIDLLVSPSPGSAFTSIFSTRPSIDHLAVSPAWVSCSNPQGGGPAFTPPPYTPPSNTTQGILNTSVSGIIPAYSAIRCDLVSAQVGGQNTGVIVHYRPI